MNDTQKRGRFTMVTVDKSIVIVGKRWRSKWWSVTCMCGPSKRRQDGSCKHERAVLESLSPDIRRMARIKATLPEVGP